MSQSSERPAYGKALLSHAEAVQSAQVNSQ